MDHIEKAKQICLERDANRCRHCGDVENVDVYQLHKRDGHLAWQLSNLVSLCIQCNIEREKALENQGSGRIGIMLCGGRGTRLFPITKFYNKHTLPIGLIPMVMYPLKTLRAFGVHRVLVVLDRDGANQIISILGSGKEFGMNISYKIQEGAGGISEALNLGRDFVKPFDEIVCILGDNIFDNNEFKADFEWKDDEKEACIFVKKVSNPQDYGVAVIDEENNITEIIEKPKTFMSDLGIVGLYIYRDKRVFDVINEIKPSDRGELEISSVNDYYASQGTLQYHLIDKYWGDAGGSIQRYAECSMHGAKQANVSAEEVDSFRSIVFDDK